MLALYRCGRQADALRAYQRLRAELGEQLGIEPSPELRALEENILLQKPELLWRSSDASSAPGSVASTESPLGGAGAIAPPAAHDLGEHRLKDLAMPERVFQVDFPGLPTDFQSVRSLDNPRLLHNLPVEVTAFIGRDREVGEVRALVERSRVTTLIGAGGSGKTRLALHVATELLDDAVDGVWLAELAAVTDEQTVPETVAHALAIPRQPGRPALESLVEALQGQDMLIVLDNCEHVIEICAKLADAIVRRCPDVHLLATSREPLAISGEAVYRVPSLSLPAEDGTGDGLSDAEALFFDRVGAQGVTFGTDHESRVLVGSICRRLDGMPLAIELAASRLRTLSLQTLHERLDQRFRLLTGGTRTALPRQQTLWATVEWSYSLLTALESRLLHRLSVFPDTFDLEAVESVCAGGDLDVFDVADLLGSLVDKSLVQGERTLSGLRYRLLETIRQFAHERLLEGYGVEAEALGDAHSDHFLAVAERAQPTLRGPKDAQLRSLAALDAERANLRRAIEHAVSKGDMGCCIRFCAALGYYWLIRSEADTVALLDSVLAAADLGAPTPTVARALLGVAEATGLDLTARLRSVERAVQDARAVGDQAVMAETLAIGAALSFRAGRDEQSRVLGEEAFSIARQTGDDWLLAIASGGFLMAGASQNPDRAEVWFQNAIDAATRTGDQFQIMALENNAGNHKLAAGDLDSARVHFERSATAAGALGMPSPGVLTNVGWIYRHQGAVDDAEASFHESLRAGRRRGEHGVMAYGMLGLACIAGDQGHTERAVVLHAIADHLLHSCGEQWQTPEDRYRDANIQRLQQMLGDDAFSRSVDHGHAMSLRDALEFVSSPSDRPVATG
jgi:predicted ATPase/Tfp pilus assembly protein PilF